jgi:hypothetical protein
VTSSYRAQIQIGVEGQRQLEQATKRINRLASVVDNLNNLSLFGGKSVQNISNFEKNVSRVSRALKDVRIGSELEAVAIKKYVTAIGEANTARASQQRLIENEIRSRQGLVSVEQSEAAARGLLAQKTEALAAAERRLQDSRVEAGGRSARRQQSVNRVAERTRNDQSAQIARERNARFGNPNATSLPAAPGGSLSQLLGALGNEVSRVNEKRYFDNLKQIKQLTDTEIELNKRAFAARKEAEDAYWADRQRQSQRASSQEIRQNIAASRRSRAGSGFADFSGTADLTGNFGQTRAERELQVLRRQNRLQSLRFRRERAQQRGGGRSDAISSALIGGGFPLLFGQGGGAAIGGGIGGAAGGLLGGGFGFGVSIVGTIIGDAVDQVANAAKELAKSLKDPTAALTALEAAGLAVGDDLKLAVDDLNRLGEAAAAQSLVFAAINKQLGPDGVQNLNALDAEQRKLDKQYQELAASLQSGLIPALTGLLNVVNGVVDVVRGLAENPLLDGARSSSSALLDQVVPGLSGIRSVFEKLQERGRALGGQAGQDRALSPAQQRVQAGAPGNRAQRELDSFNTIDRFRQLNADRARQQQDLDRQRADVVEAQERAIGDLRLSIERQVQDLRLRNVAAANRIADAQGQLRLQQLALDSQGRRNSFPTDEAANSVANALADYEQQIAEIEEGAAKRKRDTALEVTNIELQAERIKFDTARQVARINEDAATRIAKLNEGVTRANEQESVKRFQLERTIAANKLDVLAQEAAFISDQINAFGRTPEDQKRAEQFAEQARNLLAKAQQVDALQPPPPLRGVAGIAPSGVSTAGIESLLGRARDLTEALQEVQAAQDGVARQAALSQFVDRFDAAYTRPLQKAQAESTALRTSLENALAVEIDPVVTRQFVELDDRIKGLKKTLDALPPELEAGINRSAANRGFPATKEGFADSVRDKGARQITADSENRVFSLLVERSTEARELARSTGDIYGQNAARLETINAIKREGLSIDSEISRRQLEIADGIDAQNRATQAVIDQRLEAGRLYDDIAFSIRDGIVGGLLAATDASKDLNEVLSQTLRQIGQILVQAGVNNLLNSLGGGGANGFPDFIGNILPFADGGSPPVGRPSLVGEEGPELFIPGVSGTILSFDDTRDALENAEDIIAAAEDAEGLGGAERRLSPTPETTSATRRAAQASITQSAISGDTTVVSSSQTSLTELLRSSPQGSAMLTALLSGDEKAINKAFNDNSQYLYSGSDLGGEGAAGKGGAGSSGTAFSSSREYIERLNAVAEKASSDSRTALYSSSSNMKEREIAQSAQAEMQSGFSPIEVKVEAYDPAGAGLATVDQVASASKRAVAEAQAKMQQKFKNSPTFRRSVGVK